MSETATQLFNVLSAAKETVLAVAPGLKNLVPDTKAELSRLASHGATEAAAGLLNGNSFVLYGPGQDPQKWEAEQRQEQKEPEQRQQNDQNVHGSEPTQSQGRGR
jgi:hypothetical protein